MKTTNALREAASKADLMAACVSKLRQTLLKLLVDVRFLRVLALQGISSVPSPVFRTERERDEHSRSFQERIRDRAIALVSGKALSEKARRLLERLTPERLLEVAEVMILTNDVTDCHTLSLTMATPDHQLLQRCKNRANGTSDRLRRTLIREGAYTYREAKRALSGSGCDALDYVILAAFVRRLMANRDVIAWLERHNLRAMGTLTSTLPSSPMAT